MEGEDGRVIQTQNKDDRTDHSSSPNQIDGNQEVKG